jgi:ABC-2 type transport system ATP-binding protein
VISVEGLGKLYEGRVALRDLEFTVPEGEIFGFIGPNGAGKTTTIRILATLVMPDAGRATIAGVPVAERPSAVRELIGYMPDFFGVYDRLTAEEYLDFYAACHGVPRRRRRTVAHELLELVDLRGVAREQVDTLSRGMQQRLGLARALVHDPRVLLLDEPASGLDPRARIELRELVRELRRMGKTILISSHILPELEELCTWAGFIDQGRMVAAGPISELSARPGTGHAMRVTIDGDEGAELARAARLAERMAGAASVEINDDHLVITLADTTSPSALLRELVGAGVPVDAFLPVTGGLAEAFMRLTAPGDELLLEEAPSRPHTSEGEGAI